MLIAESLGRQLLRCQTEITNMADFAISKGWYMFNANFVGRWVNYLHHHYTEVQFTLNTNTQLNISGFIQVDV